MISRRSPRTRISRRSQQAANSTGRSVCAARWKPSVRTRSRLRNQSAARNRQLGPTRRARASRRPCSASGFLPACSRPNSPISRTDRDGNTFGKELKRIGYKGLGNPARINSAPYSNCTLLSGPPPSERRDHRSSARVNSAGSGPTVWMLSIAPRSQPPACLAKLSVRILAAQDDAIHTRAAQGRARAGMPLAK